MLGSQHTTVIDNFASLIFPPFYSIALNILNTVSNFLKTKYRWNTRIWNFQLFIEPNTKPHQTLKEINPSLKYENVCYHVSSATEHLNFIISSQYNFLRQFDAVQAFDLARSHFLVGVGESLYIFQIGIHFVRGIKKCQITKLWII